jgi:hypothetical protein
MSGEACVVRLRGLPSKTSKDDVLAFLDGFGLQQGSVVLNIHPRRNAGEVSVGRARVGLQNHHTVLQGQKRESCAAFVKAPEFAAETKQLRQKMKRPLDVAFGTAVALEMGIMPSVQQGAQRAGRANGQQRAAAALAAHCHRSFAIFCRLWGFLRPLSQAYVIFENVEDAKRACIKDKVSHTAVWALCLSKATTRLG